MAERDKSCPYDWHYAIDYLFSSMAERDKSRPYSLRHDISQNMQRKSLEKNFTPNRDNNCLFLPYIIHNLSIDRSEFLSSKNKSFTTTFARLYDILPALLP